MDKAVDDMVGSLQSHTTEAAFALTGLAAAGGVLVGGFLQQAAQMEQYRATLTAITGDAQLADDQLRKMTDFAAKTSFDLPGVIDAGVKIRALGGDIDKLLPLAGNMAAAMGRSIPDAASALAKAMSGSQDGIQVLADSFGISRATMAEFGAETNKQGQIISRGGDALEKLQAALTKIIQTKFGNAMEEQSKTLTGAVSNLGDVFTQLDAGLGEQLSPTFQELARNLTGAVDKLNDLDPAAKAVIASLAVGGTIAAAMGAAVLAIAAAVVPVAAAFAVWAKSAEAVALANFQAAGAAYGAAAAAAAEAEAALACAVTEGELAAATEAAAIANVELAATTEAVGLAQGKLIASSRGLGATALGALGPWLLVAAAIAAVFLPLIAYTAHLNEATAQQEKLIAVQEKQNAAFRQQRDVAIDAADAIREYGSATDEAINRVIEAEQRRGKNENDVGRVRHEMVEERIRLEEEIAAAQKAGEDTSGLQKRLDKVNEEIYLLGKVQSALQGTADKQARAAEDRKKEKSDVEELIKRYKEKDQHNVFASNKEQLKELDAILARIDKTNGAFVELSDKRIDLARKVAEEEKKQAEKVRKDQVDDQLHALDMIIGNDEAHINKRIALLQKYLAASNFNKEERKRLELDLQRELDALDKAKERTRKEAEERQKKADADKKKRQAEEARAAEKLLEAQQKGNQADLAALQDRLKRGEDVLDQVEEEIKKRDDLAAKIAMQKAKDEGVGKSSKAKADLEKAAEADVAAQKKKSNKEVEDLRREQDAKRKKEQSEAADLRAAEAKAEEDALREQLDAGGKVGDQLKQKVKERYAAEEQSLRAKAEAAKLDKSAVEQSNIERQLKLDLLKLAKDKRTEEEAISEAMRKQTDEMKAQDEFSLGKVTEGAAGAGDFSAFDLTAGKKPKGKKTADQVRADQAKDKAKAGSDSAKDAPEDGGITGQINANERAKMAAKNDETNQQILAVLKQIAANQEKPISVDVKQSAPTAAASTPPTAEKDWRTSTNRVGD